MIEIAKVSKTFPNGVQALKDISLDIGLEEFVFVVGPSGAGKTTLMKLLYRDEVPTSGQVMIDKINIAELSPSHIPYLRRNIGVIFQDFKLLPKRTVYENVAFALWVTGAGRAEIRSRTYQTLDLVGLSKKAKSFTQELSGGEQQKTCIARAIINNPPLLLADEPTGNLDPVTSWEIMELLDKVNKRKTTVIVATHNKSIVDRMKKRVVALEGGMIIRDERLGAYG
ncbi:MAG: cell division ATP-binding protein FtsE [Candidatus Saganbacteria bacterium]|nr:cell division ATP-binding protein FtsE [Candidatus Saganbacteria bacterium]